MPKYFPLGDKLVWLRKAIAECATDECLIFPYPLNPNGYGYVGFNRKAIGAYVLACEYRNGPKSDPKMQAAHECGNRACVNPRHLSWKTVSGNQMDRVKHGTSNRGEAHGMSKLTTGDVLLILGMSNFPHTIKGLAEEFGISRGNVADILAGRRWGWLKNEVEQSRA